jgi:hypothetical protein
MSDPSGQLQPSTLAGQLAASIVHELHKRVARADIKLVDAGNMIERARVHLGNARRELCREEALTECLHAKLVLDDVLALLEKP